MAQIRMVTVLEVAQSLSITIKVKQDLWHLQNQLTIGHDVESLKFEPDLNVSRPSKLL